jgi:hypothetical protein
MKAHKLKGYRHLSVGPGFCRKKERFQGLSPSVGFVYVGPLSVGPPIFINWPSIKSINQSLLLGGLGWLKVPRLQVRVKSKGSWLQAKGFFLLDLVR